MPAPLFLGRELGTTNAKAAIYDGRGQLESLLEELHRAHRRAVGAVLHDQVVGGDRLRGPGMVIAGDDVLEKLATVPTKSGGGGEKSTPIERVGVESIKIVAA